MRYFNPDFQGKFPAVVIGNNVSGRIIVAPMRQDLSIYWPAAETFAQSDRDEAEDYAAFLRAIPDEHTVETPDEATDPA